MAIVIIVVTGLLIFVVAAVTVGRVASMGAMTARQAVFDLDEAVEYVADRLPFELQARLSYDDVRTVLGWYLDELEAARVAYERDELRLPDDPDAPVPVDEDEEPVEVPETIVLDESTMAARIIGQAEAAQLGLSDVDVLLVLEEGEHYMREIGAVGGEASA